MSAPIPSRSSDANPASTVVIPTFNRSDTLLRCLQHLEVQTRKDFEVIVVDDGSTDDTAAQVNEFIGRSSLQIVLRQQENSGQGKARDLAFSLAKAPIIIMIGDDTWPRPDFVEEHLNFHREHPAENMAAVGLTRWHETAQIVTPFMRWLDNGFQFDYVCLLKGKQPDWRHFYTSNLSVKTNLLRRYPFDERFRIFEDIELGYRLFRSEGLKLVFLPNAVADHVHPTDLRRACNRAFEIGRHWKLIQQTCPEMRDPQPGRLRKMIRDFLCDHSSLQTPVRLTVDTITRVWCPNPLLEPLLGYYTELGRRSQK